jgi:hypothetical protein
LRALSTLWPQTPRSPAKSGQAAVLALGALLSSILLQAGRAQELARIEEVWVTPPDLHLTYVGGVVEAPDGAVIISDTNGRALYRFLPDSGTFSVFDRVGQGPGDLQIPVLLTLTPNGDVALYDVGRRSVLLYTANLTPVRNIQMRELITNPKGFVYLADGTYILSGGSMAARMMNDTIFAVHHYDEDGRLLYRYVQLPDSQFRDSLIQIAGGPVSSLSDGGFLYSNSAPHRILRLDGDFIEHVFAEDEGVIEPIVDRFARTVIEDGVEKTRFEWFHDQSRGVFQMSDQRVLNIITRQYRGDSIWEIWKPDGELDRRFRVPRAYRPLAKTRDDHVLAVYEHPETSEWVVASLRVLD